MKKVMIVIDYNPSAQKVAETGYEYARALNAEIVIVHAIPEIPYFDSTNLPTMGFPGFSLDGAFMDLNDQKKEALQFLECVVQHLKNNNIKTHVLDGRTS